MNAERAMQMQQWVMGFVVEGKVPDNFPQYGVSQQAKNVAASSASTVTDDVRRTRCAWWQQGKLGPS